MVPQRGQQPARDRQPVELRADRRRHRHPGAREAVAEQVHAQVLDLRQRARELPRRAADPGARQQRGAVVEGDRDRHARVGRRSGIVRPGVVAR